VVEVTDVDVVEVDVLGAVVAELLEVVETMELVVRLVLVAEVVVRDVLVAVVALVDVTEVLVVLLVVVAVPPLPDHVTESLGRLAAVPISLLSNLMRLLGVASESWLMRSRSHPPRCVTAS
jgi:hypothetical protein